MKTKLLGLFFTFSLYAIAQNPIPNAGFETWSGGSPTGWTSNNIPSIATPVTQSGSSHSGASAARLEVVSMFSVALPPTLFLTNPASVSQDYPSFSFYFKGNLNIGDELQAVLSLKNNGTSVGIGAGGIEIIPNSNVYTYTSIPVLYTGSNATDLDLNFVIGTNNASITIGTYVILDDVNVAASVGLDESSADASLSLGQAYPNPITELGLIPFSLSKTSAVSIELLSLDGKIVLHVLQTELNAGKYKAELNTSELSSGVYLCKLNAEGSTIYTKVAVN